MQKLFENFRKYTNEAHEVNPAAQEMRDRIAVHKGIEPTPARSGQKIADELGYEEQPEEPKVTCDCLCTDCIFNKSEQCIAKNIKLDFALTEEGAWICECLTYEVAENKEKGPQDSTVYGRDETYASAFPGPLKEPAVEGKKKKKKDDKDRARDFPPGAIEEEDY
jgi:hypothetical protein